MYSVGECATPVTRLRPDAARLTSYVTCSMLSKQVAASEGPAPSRVLACDAGWRGDGDGSIEAAIRPDLALPAHGRVDLLAEDQQRLRIQPDRRRRPQAEGADGQIGSAA